MATLTAMHRRDLLKAGGALIVNFALGGTLSKVAHAQTGAATELGKPLDVREVDSFLAIHANGSITLYTGKVDVGTGLRVAVRQMAAEELGVPVERIQVVEGDTALTPDQGGTGGSTGITRGAVEVRQAAATAREALIKLGAEQLKRTASELSIVDGQVRPTAGGAGVAIGTLVGGKRLSVRVDANAPLKKSANYTIVGKPLARPDVPGKCTGRHVYLQDFTLPGMLHGRVVRPPSMGAKLLSVDESSIKSIPDVKVVRIESFLGVVAPDEWAAVRAAKALKATWSEWQGLPGSDGLERFVRQSAPDRDQDVVSKGDAAAALPNAAKELSATYWWPYQGHASLGPSCSIADVRADGVTIWTSSQSTHGLRTNLATIFGVPREKMRVVYMDSAGSYGTNGGDDATADAFLLSRAAGKPVRVQWMRDEEHAWDPKGPPQVIDVRAGLDPDGRLVAWETQMWIPANTQGARPLLAPDAAGLTQSHGQSSGLITANADPPYAVNHLKVVAHWLKTTPLRPSNLRAPGKIGNVFAVESFTDELAQAANLDPVTFRLRGLSDPRAIEVIRKAAQMIGWQERTSPNPQRGSGNVVTGRGIAYARYKQQENYVAMAMEVAVERTTGKITVRRVACAHDCGLIINPDSLRNQVEGNILQTISRTLHEEVKFDHSKVTTTDWVSYPVLRFPEVPAVEVALINRPELPPLGAGEAAAAPVAGALANAVFDATGVRLRSAPFTPERVKAAINNA